MLVGLVALSSRRVADVLGGVAAALAAHTAFRLAVYGVPLPNTYYLKVVEGVSLGTRLARGARALEWSSWPTCSRRPSSPRAFSPPAGVARARAPGCSPPSSWARPRTRSTHLPALRRQARLRAAGLAVAGGLLLTTLNTHALAVWTVEGGVFAADDALIARYGVALRHTTSEDASIAVVQAGSIPYFRIGAPSTCSARVTP